MRLDRDEDTIYITDLHSTNGTFLSAGAPVRKSSTEMPTLDDSELELAKNRSYIMTGSSEASALHPQSNEDAFFMNEEGRALGVFDGMGGHAGSEEASALACRSVEHSLRRTPPVVSRSIAELAIREALENAHQAVLRSGQPNIGTTAIIAKIFETPSGTPYAMIGSAGDSRAYLIRDKAIEHVTLDHVFTGLPLEQRRNLQETLAQATDLSKLTRQERELFISRNIIDSCLGSANRGTPAISVADFPLHPGDRLLLASDGIHDNLTHQEIEEIASRDNIDVTAALIKAARTRSQDRLHPRAKPDDMTAVMLAYVEDSA